MWALTARLEALTPSQNEFKNAQVYGLCHVEGSCEECGGGKEVWGEGVG